jgi:predicted enzyme related to lactoylglutathione lyase
MMWLVGLRWPVRDMQRAVRFYEEVFGFKIELHILGELEMGWFLRAGKGTGSGGSLVKHSEYKTSADGVLIYFTAQSGDLANELSRIEKAGGKVLMPKKKISDKHGFKALFLDSEGNRIALHSRQ